jgi:hypothetical protein
MLSRAEASRTNGSKSNGPKSEDGRSAGSLNAVKHGLSAETVVLLHESEEQYHAELQAYLQHFDPANKPEDDLVRQLASAHWRLARYTGIETSLMEMEMKKRRKYVTADWKDIDDRSRLALAFESLSGANHSLALLNRYESRLQHEYQRILKALLQLQAARRSAQAKLQNEPERPPNQPIPPSSPAIDAPPAPLPPTTAILAYWKTPSFNGSPPMDTLRSFRSSFSASSDFLCPTNSSLPAAVSWYTKATCG